jgi:hypothetical protein
MTKYNNRTRLLIERLTFSTSYAYLNKSFTLNTAAFISAFANYNNAQVKMFGIHSKSTASDPICFCNNEGTTFTACNLRVWLPAGTYYLWGKGNAAAGDDVTIDAYYMPSSIFS